MANMRHHIKGMKYETWLETPFNFFFQVYGDAFEGMYPSVGACDEFIRLFLYHKVMPEKEIVSLEGYLSRSCLNSLLKRIFVCGNKVLGWGPRCG